MTVSRPPHRWLRWWSASLTATGPEAAREGLSAAVGLVLLLGVAKVVLDAGLGLEGAAFTLAAAYQLWLPLGRMDRRREDPSVYGVHAHGLLGAPLRVLRGCVDRAGRRTGWRRTALRLSGVLWPYTRHVRFQPRGAVKDLGLALMVAALTFPPFAAGYVMLQEWQAGRVGKHAVLAFHLPPGVLGLLATHLFLVALPEELFYRGYVHTLLTRAWPPRWSLRGVSLGKAVLVGSALFALGHFVGEWNPARLGPFFPALLFCALRSASGSIAGAVLYHGLSNVMGEAMRVSVTWQ